ncbi:hypothetical protein Nmel_000702 [Mimus melanotis]
MFFARSEHQYILKISVHAACSCHINTVLATSAGKLLKEHFLRPSSAGRLLKQYS